MKNTLFLVSFFLLLQTGIIKLPMLGGIKPTAMQNFYGNF